MCQKHTTKRCSRCKLVHYCGQSCQLSDYKHHKPLCLSTASSLRIIASTSTQTVVQTGMSTQTVVQTSTSTRIIASMSTRTVVQTSTSTRAASIQANAVYLCSNIECSMRLIGRKGMPTEGESAHRAYYQEYETDCWLEDLRYGGTSDDGEYHEDTAKYAFIGCSPRYGCNKLCCLTDKGVYLKKSSMCKACKCRDKKCKEPALHEGFCLRCSIHPHIRTVVCKHVNYTRKNYYGVLKRPYHYCDWHEVECGKCAKTLEKRKHSHWASGPLALWQPRNHSQLCPKYRSAMRCLVVLAKVPILA